MIKQDILDKEVQQITIIITTVMEILASMKTFSINLKGLINKIKTWEDLKTFLNNFLEGASILNRLKPKEEIMNPVLLIYL